MKKLSKNVFLMSMMLALSLGACKGNENEGNNQNNQNNQKDQNNNNQNNNNQNNQNNNNQNNQNNNNNQQPDPYCEGPADCTKGALKTGEDWFCDLEHHACVPDDPFAVTPVKENDACNPVTFIPRCDGTENIIVCKDNKVAKLFCPIIEAQETVCKTVKLSDGKPRSRCVLDPTGLTDELCNSTYNNTQCDADTDDDSFVSSLEQKCMKSVTGDNVLVTTIKACSSCDGSKCVVSDADSGVGKKVGDPCDPYLFNNSCSGYDNDTRKLTKALYCGCVEDNNGETVCKVAEHSCPSDRECRLIPAPFDDADIDQMLARNNETAAFYHNFTFINVPVCVKDDNGTLVDDGCKDHVWSCTTEGGVAKEKVEKACVNLFGKATQLLTPSDMPPVPVLVGESFWDAEAADQCDDGCDANGHRCAIIVY